MKCAVEIVSANTGGMMYIPSFMKTGNGLQAILGFA
jgi:hypothetical protein